ncbi:MAG: reverse transcriptase/maturase family protein [Patescibacteria group bacterium]
MDRIRFGHKYEDIISVENLLAAWREFLVGKRKKIDVRQFQYHLFDNVHKLHCDLVGQTYCHGGYEHFKISDPKPRDIHKASVRDRLLHHAIYRQLYPFFDRTFIYESYSCRVGKGTHKAMDRFKSLAYKVSKNHTRTCWVLKCDVRKFFASIDHEVLFAILEQYIPDQKILSLLREVVSSFCTEGSPTSFKGLPLGNLTSQLLVNIYMNEFDQYIKHKLKAKHYIRYADDFVLLSPDKQELEKRLRYIVVFLRDELKLELHPNKVSISTITSGVDFLGWVHFADHRVLRTSTKKRMLRNVQGKEKEDATVQSYFGMLSHGNAMRLRDRVAAGQ